MGQEGSREMGGLPQGAGAAASVQALQAKGIKKMDPNLQRKLKEGAVVYNMKIVIRGDSATGKSALLKRLEGGPFVAQHIPTPAIQCTNINWNYKATDEIIKVEVWDVVDHGKEPTVVQTAGVAPPADEKGHSRRSSVPGAPDANSPPPNAVLHLLDAATVDVYKGAHAVIFMLDPTRKQTFDYIKAQLPKVPKGLDVLLVVNFRDRLDHWVISPATIEQFMRKQDAKVRSAECSLTNCFGLRQVYTFLNIPFLRLKKESLMKQLELVKSDLDMAEQELDIVLSQDYEAYLKQMDSRRNSQPDVTAPGGPANQPAPSTPQQPVTAVGAAATGQKRASISSPPAQKPAPATTPAPAPASQSSPPPLQHQQSAPAPQAQQQSAASRMFSSLFRSRSSVSAPANAPNPTAGAPAAPTSPQSTNPADLIAAAKAAAAARAREAAEEANLDNFNAGDLDDNFFGDDGPAPAAAARQAPPAKQDNKSSSKASKAKPGSEDELSEPEPLVNQDDELDGPMPSDDDLDRTPSPKPAKKKSAKSQSPPSKPKKTAPEPAPAPLTVESDGEDEFARPMSASESSSGGPFFGSPVKRPSRLAESPAKARSAQVQAAPEPVVTAPKPSAHSRDDDDALDDFAPEADELDGFLDEPKAAAPAKTKESQTSSVSKDSPFAFSTSSSKTTVPDSVAMTAAMVGISMKTESVKTHEADDEDELDLGADDQLDLELEPSSPVLQSKAAAPTAKKAQPSKEPELPDNDDDLDIPIAQDDDELENAPEPEPEPEPEPPKKTKKKSAKSPEPVEPFAPVAAAAMPAEDLLGALTSQAQNLPEIDVPDDFLESLTASAPSSSSKQKAEKSEKSKHRHSHSHHRSKKGSDSDGDSDAEAKEVSKAKSKKHSSKKEDEEAAKEKEKEKAKEKSKHHKSASRSTPAKKPVESEPSDSDDDWTVGLGGKKMQEDDEDDSSSRKKASSSKTSKSKAKGAQDLDDFFDSEEPVMLKVTPSKENIADKRAKPIVADDEDLPEPKAADKPSRSEFQSLGGDESDDDSKKQKKKSKSKDKEEDKEHKKKKDKKKEKSHDSDDSDGESKKAKKEKKKSKDKEREKEKEKDKDSSEKSKDKKSSKSSQPSSRPANFF